MLLFAMILVNIDLSLDVETIKVQFSNQEIILSTGYCTQIPTNIITGAEPEGVQGVCSNPPPPPKSEPPPQALCRF